MILNISETTFITSIFILFSFYLRFPKKSLKLHIKGIYLPLIMKRAWALVKSNSMAPILSLYFLFKHYLDWTW